jgi:hypothetical protein
MQGNVYNIKDATANWHFTARIANPTLFQFKVAAMKVYLRQYPDFNTQEVYASSDFIGRK